MAITKKEFVLNTVTELQENPRAVLAGHGIPAVVLQTIIQRPDVMAKLATTLYSTVYAKKGAKGLKKAANLKINGYKNYKDFLTNSREDVELFVEGLSEQDQASFTNTDNILTIILLPDSVSEGNELDAQEIVTGKSVALGFDQAIKKEYQVAGAMYLTIMVGDSAARPAEVVVAARKEKTNKTIQNRRTPAKIKQELVAKANKKLESLKRKRAALEQTAFNTKKELEQFANISAAAGGKRTTNAISGVGSLNNFDKATNGVLELISALDEEDSKYYRQAVKYKREGNEKMVRLMLKAINNPTITAFVNNGAVLGSSALIDNRKSETKEELKRLTARNEELLASLSEPGNEGRKTSIRSMISKNNVAIKVLRAKLGTYKNISVNGMKKKAALLKEVHAAIEANIAEGADIKSALNNALDSLGAKPEEKEILKQQIMQQVAEGTPMQYAVQQSVQDYVAQQQVIPQQIEQQLPTYIEDQQFDSAQQLIPDMNDTLLSNDSDVAKLLAML